MTLSEFNSIVADTTRPTIIDVWAPWCGPCKAMKPHFDSLAGEFGERARVLAVNADESPEVTQALNVFSLPTVVVYRGGTEVARRKGAQSPSDLRTLFEAAVEGREVPQLSNRSRILRIGGALAAAMLAGQIEPTWPLQILSVVLFASAVHDRCPIVQALARPFSRGTSTNGGG